MKRSLGVLLVVAACLPQTPQPTAAPTADEMAQRPWRAAGGYASRDFALSDDTPLSVDLALSESDVADSTIERLLTHRVTLPDRVEVGILHLAGARAPRWLEAGAATELTQPLADSVVAGLTRSPRVRRAVPLPALLVGERPTVAGLREAAARVQVQVLVIYRPTCRLSERAPIIGMPQYRAECTIEATLLDTRSGVLPFTAVVTREDVTTRVRNDFTTNGTWIRVQAQALIKGGLDVAARIGSYLSTVPTAGP